MHQLHCYTGDGKGKTTAAVGLTIRAAGHDFRILFAQFMKDGQSGELNILRQLPNVTVFQAEPLEKFTFQMTPEELQQAAIQQNTQAVQLTKLVQTMKPQLLVLDELATALTSNLVQEDTAKALISTGLQYGEVAVTGWKAPAWLTDMSNYVSEIHAVKHPYQQGLQAREGIEW